MVTLVNIYAPPECDKHFFKSLFDLISVDMEGVCICGGDLNVIMNYDLDTTSRKRNGKPNTKVVKNTWEEMGFFEVWRELHPLQ